MINFNRKEMLEGRPIFSDSSNSKRDKISQSFITKNSLLYRLRPSKPKAKMIQVWESIIKWFTQFLKISRPDLLKEKLHWVIRAAGSHFSHPGTISFGNLITHYNHFFKSDQAYSPQLKRCFNRLEKDEAKILQMQRERDGISDINQEKKKEIAIKNQEKKQEQFIQKNLNEVLKMKEGSSRLLCLQRDTSTDGAFNGNLFCVITKQKETYSIRFVGSGKLMLKTHPEEKAISLGGKEKVMRELCFDNVPRQALMQDDYLKNLLKDWSQLQPLTPKIILEKSAHLNSYKKEIGSLNDLTTYSDQVDHLFWNVVKAFPVTGKQNQSLYAEEEAKRLKLRANVSTLFDLFHGLRDHLNPHTSDYQLLVKVFEGVSKQAYLAFQKGYLSQEEVARLNEELAIIEQAIQEAKKIPLSIPSRVSFKKEILKGVSLKKLSLQPKEEVEEISPTQIKLGHRIEGRKPSTQPIQIPGLVSIPSTIYEQVDTKEIFLNTFQKILEKVQSSTGSDQKQAMQEMSRLFNEMPYQPFEKNKEIKGDFSKNLHSFWWQFTPKEAQGIMEKINQFTQIALETKDPSSISQYEFESYIKMTQIVSFLNTQSTGKWIVTWDVIDLLLQYKKNHLFGDRSYSQLIPSFFSLESISQGVFKKFFTKVESSIINDLKNFIDTTYEFRDQNDIKIEVLEEEHKYVRTQAELLSQLFGLDREMVIVNSSPALGGYHIQYYFECASWNRWIRPIHDLRLKALYRYAVSEPSYVNIRPPTDVFRDRGLNTPEAFHDNPEEIFNFYLEQYLKNRKDPNNLSETNSPQVFTPDEMKCLLRLVRHSNPQVELMAFMHEFPHLMRNPDVRNFFNALFFNLSLDVMMKNKSDAEAFIDFLPSQIDQEIKRLENFIKEPLKKETTLDVELFQTRFDTLLYYYEMKEKLRDLYPRYQKSIDQFTSSKEGLAHLLQLCEERKELRGSLGYAARVHLRCLLANHVEADIPEILKDYALIQVNSIDERNTDPFFEESLQLSWQVIAKKCEESQPNLKAFLDLLCYEKDLPLDESEWKKTSENLYCNSNYKINLKTLEVSKIGIEGVLSVIPSEIAQHPHFQIVMGEKLEDLRTRVKEIGSKKIYFLKDTAGRPVQIEWEKGNLSFYKKFDIEGGKWLQVFPQNPFLPANLEKIVKDQLEPKMGFKSILKAALSLTNKIEEMQSTFSVFANYTICIDPRQPHLFYCLDEQGKVIFQLKFKETSKGLVLQDTLDYRFSPVTSWQVNGVNQLKNSALNALSSFESKGNMMLWSQKGKLKKVELPRYQLTFVYQEGQLVCSHPSFKDYFIDLSATLQDKKGLFHALVLRHPDSTKPQKLLVPEADAIVPKEEFIFPKARGFAKIALFFEKIKKLLDLVRGKSLKLDQRVTYEIDSTKNKLSFTAFDIRPYTGEICKQKENWGSNLLQLIKQALKTDQPVLAWEMLKKLDLRPEILNQVLLNEYVAFIQQPTNNGAEAALKIKLCYLLKAHLKRQKKLNKQMGNVFNGHILQLGKILFAHGRKIPNELQFTREEHLELARIFKKYDLDYYHQHLKVYFIKEGTLLSPSLPLTAEDQYEKNLATWKTERAPVKQENRIENLEKELSPTSRLEDSKLAYTIPRSAKKTSLLDFSEADEKHLFEQKKQELPTIKLTTFAAQTSCEKQALESYQSSIDQFKNDAESQHPYYSIKASKQELKKFVLKKLFPQKIKYEKQMVSYQNQIEKMLRESDDEKEQMAIFAGHHPLAAFDELRQALAHDSLEELQQKGRLPCSLDISKLRENLISYFDAFSRRNASEAAFKLIKEIIVRGNSENQEEWQSMSEALYRLLTIQRSYDVHQDPRLLIFEAQQFINLKPLDGGLDQLSLLDALVKNPYAVVQAPTGAGKTSVLSVMRSLLKANGENLVIQKVLPALLQQTYDKFQDVLGELYGTSIYLLQFNLKMRMSKQEVKLVQNVEGKWEEKKIEHSIFKGMYHDLLETIKNKGCVLTDYKSFPLLEGMFFKIGQELLENHQQGISPTPLLEEHFTYLRKILIMLKNKADENMDEFDQPNRPIQKIQIDLGVGAHMLPSFLIDHSLEIYEMLAQDPDLKLTKNIQADIDGKTRQEILERNAQKMAQKLAQEAGDPKLKETLLEYLLGKNEKVLALIQGQSPAYKDRLALCKDQFSIYLALTLKYKEGSRYARSKDGSKTLPCYNGEKHDAKFGSILEQINYTIQDYLQTGIKLYDLKPWVNEFKRRWDETEDTVTRQQILTQFHQILPSISILEASKMVKTEKGANTLIKQINQDASKIKEFLTARLRQIKTSGALISMDPQNIGDMSRVISGVSATIGAPESLHRQFQTDAHMNGQIQASMTYRLLKRAQQEKVIKYDPENPALMLQGENHAIIDGAGAFKDSKQAAEALIASNPSLQQVGYHKEDESIAWVGRPTGDLEKTGFDFSQSHTRGTDIRLAPDAKAILTLTEKDGIRDYFQKEGRLRQERQRYQLAISKYQNIETVSQKIAQSIAQDALVDAQDIFGKSKQELKAIMRSDIKEQLLNAENISDFIALFQNEEWKSYCILIPEPHFENEGSYFNARQHIQQEDQKPGNVLTAYQAGLIQKAQDLGLKTAAENLKKIQYSEELLSKMPENVTPLEAAQGELETEIHVEQEEESEQEQELELETQQEQVRGDQRSLGSYPIRLMNQEHVFHGVADKIHPAYDSLLYITDAFLPFSREGSQSLHERRPFDETRYAIGEVCFDLTSAYSKGLFRGKITRVTIDDPLRDTTALNKFRYDIRTDKIVNDTYNDNKMSDGGVMTQDPEFIAIIAQVKFLDGRISGYSQAELDALAAWLHQSNPEKMQKHLLNEILRYRYQDKKEFVGSQLHQVFEQLKGR